MTPKTKYYETLANTMIKNFEKRRMDKNHPEDFSDFLFWRIVK